MSSTKVKTPEEIAQVRKLHKEKTPLKAIARKLNYSINTVRKIIRYTKGYETDKFDHQTRWKNVGGVRSCPNYISEIDGEELYLQKGHNNQYHRISKKHSREAFHIYEAKKIYNLLGIPWKKGFIVHHVNKNKLDCSLSNLAVMDNSSAHITQHSQMEKEMYSFLADNNLLARFYLEHPEVKIVTLKDELSRIENEESNISSTV